MRRLALFYIFTNLPKVWYNRSQMNSFIAPACNLLHVKAEGYEKKNWISHRYMVGKWRDILIAFSSNYGHQNSAVGSCLKVSCNLESKTTISFLSFVALKPIGCHCTLSGPFTRALFYNFGTGHWESKYCYAELYGSYKYWHIPPDNFLNFYFVLGCTNWQAMLW